MKTNRIIIGLVAIFGMMFCLLAGAQTNQTAIGGPITNHFQMVIKLRDGGNVITNGFPCVLLISYRNLSTNETFEVDKRGELDSEYSFTVISPSAKDVSPDMKGFLDYENAAIIPVPPGQSIEMSFELSRLLKFDENGTYKIVAEKNGPWRWPLRKKNTIDPFRVVSNPLYVTVIPSH